ncbi:MAG: helix-turn-helix domain-containing protein [Defluviitaleaceae bacterium]|nr:helix-turn-helix domain-containing protein [Defluviitaleaceae bacterium]
MALSTEGLINEFLTFKASKISDTEKLIAKCEKRLAREPNERLKLCLLALKTFHADDDNQIFSHCCAIAVPIFKHLEETKGHWEFLDLHILTMIIGYLPTYQKTSKVVEEALKVLDDEAYATDFEYRAMRMALYSNLTLRLLRAKSHEVNVDMTAVTEAFTESYDYLMVQCKQYNSPYQYVYEIRKAVFENKQDKIQECLEMLLELGERKMYRTSKAEIAEFLATMSDSLQKPLSYILFGHQLSKRMKQNKMSLEDLAFLTDIEPNALQSYMRGDAGVSLERARKLANKLGITVDYFFGDDTKVLEDVDSFLLLIKAYTLSLSEEAKDTLAKLIKANIDILFPNANTY